MATLGGKSKNPSFNSPKVAPGMVRASKVAAMGKQAPTVVSKVSNKRGGGMKIRGGAK